MSFKPGAPIGAQRPRVSLRPVAPDGRDADDAVALSSAYGLVPDDWQAWTIRGWLSRKRDGKLAASRCGIAVPRQNGKNGILEIVELFKLVVLGRRILHTAHEVKTARKAFLRLCSFFENPRQYPELAALVRDIRRTNGQEAIYLLNGGSIEFIARSKGSGRGFTVDDLVCDEAQELSEDALAALLPTISAAPSGDPQVILTGTPPAPSMSGDVWTRMRTAGIERKDKRLCWDEWSSEGAVDLDDIQQWISSNPALGGRLSLDVLKDEREAFDDDTFARERLGMWAGTNGTAVIDPITWASAADVSSVAIDRLALAVDVSPDRSVASISLAGQRADGMWHMELDEQRNGVGWLVPWLVARCSRNDIRAVVIDGMSPAASIIDDLRQHKIKVTTTAARDMAAACGTFYDGVMEGWLRHTDQPQVNAALSVARKRALQDAWAWNRKNATSDITPLVSCTLALWGAQSSTVTKPSRSASTRRVVVL
jgi:hypothetical protein